MEKQDVTNVRFDRQDVRGKSRALKGTNEPFPAVINSERKERIKVMKEKRQQGHKTRFVYNKLYVDDILYKPPANQTNPNVQEHTGAGQLHVMSCHGM